MFATRYFVNSSLRLVQGWLLGTDGSSGHLVPFELAGTLGNGRVTTSGPIPDNLVDSFQLSRWAATLALKSIGQNPKSFDYHINFPLHKVEGTGASCRLAFAAAVLELQDAELRFLSEHTIFSGDLCLSGRVLPVEGLEEKLQLSNPLILSESNLVLSKLQKEAFDGAFRVECLGELLKMDGQTLMFEDQQKKEFLCRNDSLFR